MSSFIAYLNQDGGCDYTIGCGKLLITIEADSLELAKIKLYEIIEKEYNFSEFYLSSAEIFEVSSSEKINVKQIYKELNEKEKARIERMALEKDLAEFERLKKKFNS